MAGEAGKVLVEGSVWLWDREEETTPKAWLSRWCLINKVGSRLRVRIYKSMKHSATDTQCLEVSMDNFSGIEAFQSPYEGKPYCFSLVTYYKTYCIAVASRDTLQSWFDCISSEVGHEWTFNVRVLATQNIVPAGEAIMRFYPRFFSLTNGTPPVCLGLWQHNHLRRYGGAQGFSFESGSRSIGGPEVYRLATSQGAAIKDLFDCVAHGRPLPDPPAAMKRTISASTAAGNNVDDSDTWSMSSVPASSRTSYSTSPSSYAFANDTVSLSGSSAYDVCDEKQETPVGAGKPRSRDVAYDYVSVDLPRRAPAERDVNYLSVQVGGSGAATPGGPAPSQTVSSTSSPTLQQGGSAPSSTIYSGVDLQKTAQLREALVQSGRNKSP